MLTEHPPVGFQYRCRLAVEISLIYIGGIFAQRMMYNTSIFVTYGGAEELL